MIKASFTLFNFKSLLGVLAVLGLIVTTPAEAITTKAKQALLVDFETGTILFEKAADEIMTPSSMSKMMTIYMVFEHLRDGRLSLDDKLEVSTKAWRKGGSKMFVREKDHVRVEDLIRGIIVQSGNDACIVIAEGLAENEEAFALEMTLRARELGLKDSSFKNATGWPDPDHKMTARDIARLAELTIREFPEYYHYYAEKSFKYGKMDPQPNRNKLLSRGLGADGLKTGHTEAGGYGLASSAERNGRRLILVVNGLTSEKERLKESERLLEWGFREFNNYHLYSAGDTVTNAAVWLGAEPTVPLVINQDLVITLPRKSRRNMVVKAVYDDPFPAPIAQDSAIARLVVSAPDVETLELPLIAGTGVNRLGPMGRLTSAFKYLLWGGLDLGKSVGSKASP